METLIRVSPITGLTDGTAISKDRMMQILDEFQLGIFGGIFGRNGLCAKGD
jgi:hypothetical protein